MFSRSLSCASVGTVECTRMRNEEGKKSSQEAKADERGKQTNHLTHCAFLLQQRQHQNLIKNSLDGEKWVRVGVENAMEKWKTVTFSYSSPFHHSRHAHNGAQNTAKKASETISQWHFRLNEWILIQFLQRVKNSTHLVPGKKCVFWTLFVVTRTSVSPVRLLWIHCQPDEEKF